MGRDLDGCRAPGPRGTPGRRSRALTVLARRAAGAFPLAALALAATLAAPAHAQTPDEPENTRLSGGVDTITVTWDDPIDAPHHYRVRHKENNQTDFFNTAMSSSLITGTATSYDIAGLIAGRTYYIAVGACSSTNVCAYDDIVSGRIPLAAGMQAVAQGDGAVSLQWLFQPGHLADGDAIRVEYKKTETASWTGASHQSATHPTFSVNVTGLDAGASYDFRMRGTHAGLNSPWSNVATVAGKPDSPGSFAAATSTTPGSVDLSWNAPANTGGKDLNGYTVQWRPDANGDWNQHAAAGTSNVGPSAAGITLGGVHGLDPGTTYNFRISATNANRRSYWTPGDGSAEAATSADPNQPPGKVPNVQATANSSTQITITWDEPTTGGTLGWYQLNRRIAGNNWSGSGGSSNTLARQRVNSNLHPGTIYEFRLRACKTSAETNCGGWSDTASATTHYIAPEAPRNFAAVALNDDNNGVDRLTWDPPANTGVTGYDFQFRVIGSAWPANLQDAGTLTSANQGKSSSADGYEYRVRARNTEGTSPWTAPLKVGGKPGIPAHVVATASTVFVAVNVSWTAPSNGGKPLTGYRVEWREDATGDWTANPAIGHEMVPGHATDVSINEGHGLQPNTVYDFRVRADNEDRVSFYSSTAQAAATVNIAARVSATDPSPLTEAALDGATLTVDLVGVTYASSLSPAHFALTPAVSGLSVAQASRTDDDTAVLTLAFVGDLTADAEFAVRVEAAGTDHTAAVTTGTVAASATRIIDLGVNPSSVGEDAGATTVSVTATLSAGSPTSTSATQVTVAVGAPGDSAAEGTDYENVNDLTVTIPANLRSSTALSTFTLTPIDDTAGEGDETITVGGTPPAGFTAVNSATLTLLDDDAPVVSVADAEGAEGGPVTFTVSISQTIAQDVTVNWSTADARDGRRAKADSDYTAVTGGTVVIPANGRSATFEVETLQDILDEYEETFRVRLSEPPGGLPETAQGRVLLANDPTATGTIADDDPPPVLWAGMLGIEAEPSTEGDSGTRS
ncbi:MAG: hypothetical protein F4164_05130, partial [Gemmatimonadales bacterium]|nr:hypothetical protein [Holophagales bacterium]MYG48754.1 hypothetical protein [Gemmatimonadales bacterium]